MVHDFSRLVQTWCRGGSGQFFVHGLVGARKQDNGVGNQFPTAGPVGFQSLGLGLGRGDLQPSKSGMEPWNPGTLEPWNPGTLEIWNLGTLEPWNSGTLEPWNPGIAERWNPGTLEPWKPGPWNPAGALKPEP